MNKLSIEATKLITINFNLLTVHSNRFTLVLPRSILLQGYLKIYKTVPHKQKMNDCTSFLLAGT